MGKCQFAGGWPKWVRIILQQKQSDQKSGCEAGEDKADPEKFGLINFLFAVFRFVFCSITMLSFLLKKNQSLCAYYSMPPSFFPLCWERWTRWLEKISSIIFGKSAYTGRVNFF